MGVEMHGLAESANSRQADGRLTACHPQPRDGGTRRRMTGRLPVCPPPSNRGGRARRSSPKHGSSRSPRR